MNGNSKEKSHTKYSDYEWGQRGLPWVFLCVCGLGNGKDGATGAHNKNENYFIQDILILNNNIIFNSIT